MFGLQNRHFSDVAEGAEWRPTLQLLSFETGQLKSPDTEAELQGGQEAHRENKSKF